MKRSIAVIVAIAVIMSAIGISGCSKGTGADNRISISGAWALYPMMARWTKEYSTLHPEIKFDLSAGGAGKGMADALAGTVNLGMVSRDITQAELDKGAWWIAVVKDAVVPTMNSANPALAAIRKRGLTRDDFHNIWVTGKMQEWNGLVPGIEIAKIRPFTRSDSCGAAETWAKYLGVNQEDLKGDGVYGDPGVADAVKADVRATGFNNIAFAYDVRSGLPINGVAVIPIDINANGTIDPEEDVYGSLTDITAAIAAGVYPSPPARPLNVVAKSGSLTPQVRAFLEWILTDGQAFVTEAGYVKLSAEQLTEHSRRIAR